jgi:hypothetical protein
MKLRQHLDNLNKATKVNFEFGTQQNMNIHIIYISFIFLFLISCSEKGIIEHYENGKIKKQYINLTDSTGLEKRFDILGNLVAEIELKDTVKHGLSRIYDQAYIYDLIFINGKQTINWNKFDRKGNQLYINKEVKFNNPQTIEVLTNFYGTAELASYNSDSLKAFFLCDVSKNGLLYTSYYSDTKELTRECKAALPIKEKKAIISFTLENTGKKEFGLVFFEHLRDEFFLPYHGVLRFEVTPNSSRQ